MIRMLINGVDVECDEDPDAELTNKIASELKEISELGVTVYRVRIPSSGGSPMYDFGFPQNELQYKTRLAAEKIGFDVGQKMGGKSLSFYLSKRTKKTEGWQV